ncbi:sucrose-6-phosphate hydrolase [Bacillus mangrovi]|uniref:Sucrose-6-phosphate hydrolase n=2 Tax=Metabacillus mangrovi TaxID=1491830 RepID=A0A7X2V4G3_9BACI|nr:glycoside hydrolase family 32 protein [Metabacillus mangrovi]MTH53084.1 sucrose-6-phosphate hydrolase [Metabacillus mangrovi]
METAYERLLLSAQKEASDKGETIKDTPYRLGFHISAPANWINDPNGLIQFKGEYHVFYQFHPFSEKWGPMYWGHVKSKDLVHWEQLPIALAPFEDYDRDGCFSGSAVEHDGKMGLIYTGNVWLDDQQQELKQVQCLAWSTDGVNFTKDCSNPVLSRIPEEGSSHFRDPKVWKHESSWYMVLGTKKNELGKVLLYQSDDLQNWKYEGVLAENKEENLGFMWECPDFFELGGRHVLLISPEGMEQEGTEYVNLKQTGYFTGEFSYETMQYKHGQFFELDKGHDFYAAQTFLDDTGRRILIAWMDMWEQEMPSQEDGWAGALTIPRVLSLDKEGRLLMHPVAELDSLRKEKTVSVKEYAIENELVIGSADMAEIAAEFRVDDPGVRAFGVKVRCGDGEETVLTIVPDECKLVLDRENSGKGPGGGLREAKLSQVKSVSLRIFLDRSSIEVFADGGACVLTSRIFPSSDSLGIKLFAEGGTVNVQSAEVWTLGDAYIKR